MALTTKGTKNTKVTKVLGFLITEHGERRGLLWFTFS